ncbi:hypothetical protein R77591_01877 [Ralstonia mannitolilytica]|uniref:Uncharacterized protein n=1 Tax=Ralstonia mannitolilytica TaxID=105219 RepID=A0AAD2AKQ3_9RALS|nr:hypothetical protein R77591_01877 [Ralstonia mannitolilytica]
MHPPSRIAMNKKVPAGGRSTKRLSGPPTHRRAPRCGGVTWMTRRDSRPGHSMPRRPVRAGAGHIPHFRGGCARFPGVGLLSHACDVLGSPSGSTGTTEPGDGSNARVGRRSMAACTGNVSVKTPRKATSSAAVRRTKAPSTTSARVTATTAARFATTPVPSIIHLNGKRRALRCAIAGMARSSPKNRERHPCHDV